MTLDAIVHATSLIKPKETHRVILQSETARVEVDEKLGGRLSSLRIDGLEILVARERNPLAWGCYPMAPWAGRVRNGRFRFVETDYVLPLRMPPHAIHGTVLDRAWNRRSDDSLQIDLGADWPWRGFARQSFELAETSLRMRLEVHSEDVAFPASVGWHPWFRRRLGLGDELAVAWQADSIYVTDGAGIPTGEKHSPGSGPFDDCFTDLRGDPILRWVGAIELTLSSSFDHWVIFDEPDHAICVEPLSGPPDALNIAPRLVAPGQPLIGEFRIDWRLYR
ncbi:MAG TPA: aldose 1-epimerase [Myxococcales bacterium]|nr:aldose 1-epimerase [Myxococcales bacterium]HIK86070.1 aldose 1-epimerase [Myxococcales bacterium]